MHQARPALSAAVSLTGLLLPAAALVILFGDVLPVSPGFARAATAHLCVLETQIFFALFVWPLFPGRRSAALDGAAVVVLGLPLVLVGANLSDASPAAVAAGQTLVSAVLAFTAVLSAAGARLGRPVGPWIVASGVVLAAGVPLLALLVRRFGGTVPGEGPDLSYLAAVSPFWAAVGAGTSLILAAVLAAAAVAVWLAARGRAARGRAA